MVTETSLSFHPSLLDEWSAAVEQADTGTIHSLHQANPDILWAPLFHMPNTMHVQLCERLGASITPFSVLEYALVLHHVENSPGTRHFVQCLVQKVDAQQLNEHFWGDGQNTTLHLASFFGQEAIVRLLVDKGASAEISNRFGYLPRDVAATQEMAQLLRSKTAKADPLRPKYSTPGRFKELKSLAEHSSTGTMQQARTDEWRRKEQGRYFKPGYVKETKQKVLGEDDAKIEVRRARRLQEVALLAQRSPVTNNPFVKRSTEHHHVPLTANKGQISDEPESTVPDELLGSDPHGDTTKLGKDDSLGISALMHKSYVSSSVFRRPSVISDKDDGMVPLNEQVMTSTHVIQEQLQEELDDARVPLTVSEDETSVADSDKHGVTDGVADDFDVSDEPSKSPVMNEVVNVVKNEEPQVIPTQASIDSKIPPLPDKTVLPASKIKPTSSLNKKPVEPTAFQPQPPKSGSIQRKSIAKSKYLSIGTSSWFATLDREFKLLPLGESGGQEGDPLTLFGFDNMTSTGQLGRHWPALDTAVNDRTSLQRGVNNDSGASTLFSEEAIDQWFTSALPIETSNKANMLFPNQSNSSPNRLPSTSVQDRRRPLGLSTSKSMPMSLSALAKQASAAEGEDFADTSTTTTMGSSAFSKIHIRRKPVPLSFSSPTLLQTLNKVSSVSTSCPPTVNTSSLPLQLFRGPRPRFGKLYVCVKGVHDLLIPLPKDKTFVRCVVSDGRKEYTSRNEILCQNVAFHHECLIDTYPDMIITISLQVRHDLCLKMPLARLFTPSRKRKQYLAGYVYGNEQSIGQAKIPLSDIQTLCDRKAYESRFHCFNAWVARNPRERQKQAKDTTTRRDSDCVLKVVGDFCIELLYVPISDPTQALPSTLRDCEMAIKARQWKAAARAL